MTIIDASMFPRVDAIGEALRGKRSKWAYSHEGANGCCIEALMEDHDAGALTPSTISICRCGRAWTLQAGTWRIGVAQPEPAQRPLAKLRHGREAGLERLAAKREKRDELQAKE